MADSEPSADETAQEKDQEVTPEADVGFGHGIDAELGRRMLIFEKRWSQSVRRGARVAGLREEAIRREFEMDPVRYHQRLNYLLDSPRAAAENPVVVHHLRRLRDGDPDDMTSSASDDI